jgi:hypothetical protein
MKPISQTIERRHYDDATHNRQGGQPWALRHVPDDRGRGVAADIRGHLVADCPAAGPAYDGMNGASGKCSGAGREETWLGAGGAAYTGASLPSTARLNRPLPAARRFAVAQAIQRRDQDLETAGNLASIG